MNGFKATKAIKEGLPETDVLIVSAEHFSYSEVERWGAEGYVSSCSSTGATRDHKGGALTEQTDIDLRSRWLLLAD
jgi:hypothetical protein